MGGIPTKLKLYTISENALAAASHCKHRQVVESLPAISKRPHIVEAGGDQFRRLPRGLTANQGHDAVHAIFTALVAGFGQPVRVKKKCVAGFQLHARSRELRFEE